MYASIEEVWGQETFQNTNKIEEFGNMILDDSWERPKSSNEGQYKKFMGKESRFWEEDDDEIVPVNSKMKILNEIKELDMQNEKLEKDIRNIKLTLDKDDNVLTEDETLIENFGISDTVKGLKKRVKLLQHKLQMSYETTPCSMKEHISDIILYILSGIFVIILMELFVKAVQ